MTPSSEPELEQWARMWQNDDGSRASPDAIRRHVQRRGRLLALWIAGEFVIGVGFATFLAWRLILEDDPADKAALGMLAIIAASATAFGWHTWHGVVRASGETTRAHIALSVERARRLRAALRAGWWILAAEVAVFTPWIAYQLYSGPIPASLRVQLNAWGLLAAMSAGAAVCLWLADRWARRDQVVIDELRREIDGEA